MARLSSATVIFYILLQKSKIKTLIAFRVFCIVFNDST